jgi:DNA modification methylase
MAADNFAPAGSLDLVYADPPFFTNREFAGAHRDGSGQKLTFADRWAGPDGRNLYLSWLEERIRAFRPLLTPTGIFLLHLDWHVVHYAKVLCDTIFGEDNFQNELIWYYQTGGASKDRFSRKHDTILLYSNGPTFPFDGKSIAIPRTPKAMKRAQCATGARIKATDTHKNPDDVLIVPALNPMAIERTGYPTQKPVELLERLIKALTPPNGTVGDFFCGSGTTLVAAKNLGRRYIGCDVNPAAVEIARKRLAAV